MFQLPSFNGSGMGAVKIPMSFYRTHAKATQVKTFIKKNLKKTKYVALNKDKTRTVFKDMIDSKVGKDPLPTGLHHPRNALPNFISYIFTLTEHIICFIFLFLMVENSTVQIYFTY